ncbi:hypothetical protein Tco_0066631, partial [Tanacetum coccineum]
NVHLVPDEVAMLVTILRALSGAVSYVDVDDDDEKILKSQVSFKRASSQSCKVMRFKCRAWSRSLVSCKVKISFIVVRASVTSITTHPVNYHGEKKPKRGNRLSKTYPSSTEGGHAEGRYHTVNELDLMPENIEPTNTYLLVTERGDLYNTCSTFTEEDYTERMIPCHGQTHFDAGEYG